MTSPLSSLPDVESRTRAYTSSSPRMFTSAKGVRIRDSKGREYIDCISNAGALTPGHTHPELSKAIGGGHPMSAVISHKRPDAWLPGMHAGTFRGNQIGMVAGEATMPIIERDGLGAQAAKSGELLMAGLRRIARDFPFLAEIRGRGLMVGVEVPYADSAMRPAANARHGPSHVSALRPDQMPSDALLGHARNTLDL